MITKFSPAMEEMLVYLDRYQYLDTTFFMQLTGAHERSVNERLAYMRDKGHIIKPPHSHRQENEKYKPKIHQITELGRFVLWEKKKLSQYPHRPSSSLWHDYSASMVPANCELSTRKLGLRYIDFEELTLSKKFNRECLTNPFVLNINGERLIPDYKPWAIEYNGYIFFLLERDMNTETYDTFKEKLKLYNIFFYVEMYRTHFGFPKPYIIISTTTKPRLAKLKKLVEKYCAGHKDRFLFQIMADPSTTKFSIPPNPNILTEPWDTVDGEIVLV